MIKIKISQNKLTIEGHADFADFGKDIVCAAVSSIIVTSVNDMMSIDEESIKYNDDGKVIIIENIKNNELVIRLLNNLKELLINLSKDYPKNIKIESEE